MASPIEVIKLNKGDNVIAEIRKFVAENGWKEVLVLTGVGSVVNVVVQNPLEKNIPPKMEKTQIEGPCEVLSFVGEVSEQNGEPFVHVHLTASIAGGNVYGGGLRKAEVFRQLNLYVQKIA